MAEARSKQGISLIARVLLIITFALVCGGIGVGWLVFHTATEQAGDVFDSQLAQTAGLLIALADSDADELPDRRHAIEEGELNGSDSALSMRSRTARRDSPAPSEYRFRQRLIYQVWQAEPMQLILRSPRAPETPLPVAANGFSDQQWKDSHWRFYRLERDGRIAIVGQDARVRGWLTHEFGEHGFVPLTLGFGATLLLTWAGVALGLRPLSKLTREVQARAPERLDPLDAAKRPRELAVLVAALDALFERVAHAFEHERRFTADAAHELRTPLAALSAQIQVAQTAADAATRNARLEESLRGLQRMARLVEQLLAVARLDALDGAKREPVDATELARKLAAELAPGAFERGIELALDAPQAVTLAAQPDLLRAALRNLVDNAIRHSPAGATVEIALREDGGMLIGEVRDSGLGVPEPLRQRLGERFLRVAGSETGGAGLGLSIVRRIAELHGGSLEFAANSPQGLIARLKLPTELQARRSP
ncbi:MAG: ATP-binding protein [Betaproteobacteria bacterium]|nr:ATP-binding protein [Betaproteobacteria bacterium]